jgi:MoaA/NifB/PqqE/SkfB family radical SAM enzyme
MRNDEYRFDSHKLMFHPARVQAWLEGRRIAPIYLEISPSGSCNHRCRFCAMDFYHQRRFLDADRMRTVFQEMSTCGVKSIMFGGEGEPLLHPNIAALVRAASMARLDIGITTNASLLTHELAAEIMPCIKWLKASVDAGTRDTYAKLHGVKAAVFDTVINNLEYAGHLNGGTIGVQMLWLPENKEEVATLAEIAREIEMDYLVVKPYSQHPSSKTKLYAGLDYSDWEQDRHDPFIIWRSKAIEKWDDKTRPYDECLALPFWGYIDSGGTVWGCSAHIGVDEFNYGNINESAFWDIWKDGMDYHSIDSCRYGCRMDECNRYLWELRNPSKHKNFI